MEAVLSYIFGIIFAPFLFGIINRVKAVFAGRKGQPLFQLYFDIIKLFRKQSLYSKTTTWFFKAGPVILLLSNLTCLAFIPLFGNKPLLGFFCDILILIYLLGIGRFFMVLASLDTGSSFEGMGASRDMFFGFLSEPVILVSFLSLAILTGQASISEIFLSVQSARNFNLWIIYILIGLSLFIVFLSETYRVPFDDPNTHLELTMIHEVMVLDNSGPDFGIILSASSIKYLLFSSIVANIFLPKTGIIFLNIFFFMILLVVISIIVGVIESTAARLRLNKVPILLATSLGLAILSFVLQAGRTYGF